MPSGLPKNEPGRAQDDPKRAQESPRWSKTRPKATQDDPKRHPRGSKKRTRTARRKKDRTKTIPRPSWTAHQPICLVQRPPRGSIWEPKTAPKSIPKRTKIEVKNQDEKNRSKTILGPSWGDLGPSWVPSWGPRNALALRLPMFREHSLFRC